MLCSTVTALEITKPIEKNYQWFNEPYARIGGDTQITWQGQGELFEVCITQEESVYWLPGVLLWKYEGVNKCITTKGNSLTLPLKQFDSMVTDKWKDFIITVKSLETGEEHTIRAYKFSLPFVNELCSSKSNIKQKCIFNSPPTLNIESDSLTEQMDFYHIELYLFGSQSSLDFKTLPFDKVTVPNNLWGYVPTGTHKICAYGQKGDYIFNNDPLMQYNCFWFKKN